MEINTSTTNFLGLQPKEFQDIYYLYLDLLAAKENREQIKNGIAKKILLSWGFPENAALKLSDLAIKQFEIPGFATKFIDSQSKTHTNTCFITSTDYTRYCELISHDPHVSTELKNLLMALMVTYRRNYHKSGWVRYDKKNIIYMADLGALSPQDQEDLTQYLHQEYGLNMQVIGSNSPTPCFKMDWLFNQAQPGSHINPFLDLGPFIPQTIHRVVSGMIDPTKNSFESLDSNKEGE